jgi:hypothetical protein
MSEHNSAAWPLLFTYSGTTIGQGFLASVNFCGRLLAWSETEGVWLDGVNPGGFAVGGKSLDEANVALRDTLLKVLVAFAAEAGSFDEFKAAVTRFYYETDSETVAWWEASLEAFKAGVLPVPSGLQRKPPEWQCFITIEPKRLEDLTARDNPISRSAANTDLAKAA